MLPAYPDSLSHRRIRPVTNPAFANFTRGFWAYWGRVEIHAHRKFQWRRSLGTEGRVLVAGEPRGKAFWEYGATTTCWKYPCTGERRVWTRLTIREHGGEVPVFYYHVIETAVLPSFTLILRYLCNDVVRRRRDEKGVFIIGLRFAIVWFWNLFSRSRRWFLSDVDLPFCKTSKIW